MDTLACTPPPCILLCVSVDIALCQFSLRPVFAGGGKFEEVNQPAKFKSFLMLDKSSCLYSKKNNQVGRCGVGLNTEYCYRKVV